MGPNEPMGSRIPAVDNNIQHRHPINNNDVPLFNPNMNPIPSQNMALGPVGNPKAPSGLIPFPQGGTFMPGPKPIVGSGMPLMPPFGVPPQAGLMPNNQLVPASNQLVSVNKKEAKRIQFKKADEKPGLEKATNIKYGAWNNNSDIYKKEDDGEGRNDAQKMLEYKEHDKGTRSNSAQTVTQRRLYVNASMRHRFYLDKENFGKMSPLPRIEYLDGKISCYAECLFNLERALCINSKEDQEVFKRTINYCDKISRSIMNEKASPIDNREHILALVVYSFDWLLFENVQKYSGEQSFDNPLNIYHSLNKSLIKRPPETFPGALGYLGYLDQALVNMKPLKLANGHFCYCWSDFEPEFIDAIKKVGTIVQLTCYQSAVLEREALETVFEGRNRGIVVFKIASVSGRDVTPFSTVTVKQAVLLPGTKYKVDGVSDNDGNIEITLVETN